MNGQFNQFISTKLLIEYRVATYFIWATLPEIRTGLKQLGFTANYLFLKPEQPLTVDPTDASIEEYFTVTNHAHQPTNLPIPTANPTQKTGNKKHSRIK